MDIPQLAFIIVTTSVFLKRGYSTQTKLKNVDKVKAPTSRIDIDRQKAHIVSDTTGHHTKLLDFFLMSYPDKYSAELSTPFCISDHSLVSDKVNAPVYPFIERSSVLKLTLDLKYWKISQHY